MLYKCRIPVFYANEIPVCYLNKSKGYVDFAFWHKEGLNKYQELLVTSNRKSVASLQYKSSDEIDGNISNQNLIGTVLGQDFTFVDGIAFETTFGDEVLISVNLTNVGTTCDDSVLDFVLSVRAQVLNQIGVYNDINIVEQNDNGTPFNNLNQTVEITSIRNTEISGKMKIDRSSSDIAAGSSFEGTFTLPICD